MSDSPFLFLLLQSSSVFMFPLIYFFILTQFQSPSNRLFRSVPPRPPGGWAFKSWFGVTASQNTGNLRVLISGWQQEVPQALPFLAVTDFDSGRRSRGRLNVQSVLICSRRAAVWRPPAHSHLNVRRTGLYSYSTGSNQFGLHRSTKTLISSWLAFTALILFYFF